MTTAQTATPAPAVGTGVPAGLNEAQRLVWKRLETARAAITNLEPIDLDETDAERRWTQWRRWNGEDL